MSKLVPGTSSTNIGERFLTLLPILELKFQFAFRHFQGDQRDDALQEATVNAFVVFVRLWQQGKTEVATPTPLALYAIRHWFAGRRVGARLNRRDVSSPYAQRSNAITLQRLDRYEVQHQAWQEITVEDRRTPVPDQAAFRVDFPAWLRQLSRRNRCAALKLAAGATTLEVARSLKLSPARVSQLRREFHESWQQFHGEVPDGVRHVPEAAIR